MPARRLIIDGVERIDPRHTRAWRRLRDQVVAEEPVCQLQLPGVCTQLSTTADHIVPVIEAPELALERSNCRGTCTPCNDARGILPDRALRMGSLEPADGGSALTRCALSIFD